MKAWLKVIADLSHSTHGITKVGAWILLCGVALVGFSTILLPEGGPEEDIDDIHTMILAHYYHALFTPDILMEPPPPLPEGISWIFQGNEEAWLPRLTEEAATPDPSKGVCFARALWHWNEEEHNEAVVLLRKENDLYPSAFVRDMTLTVAITSDQADLLKEVTEDPTYEQEMSSGFQVSRGVAMQDWSIILKHFIPSQFENYTPLPVSLTLMAGLIWSVLIFSFNPSRPSLPLLLMGGLALVFGALSTWPTILSMFWTEFEFGWVEGNDFFTTLIYMVASVGFREEVLKVLFFSPLLIYTVKAGRDLEALLLGAMVGLGFAIEENINYFAGYGGGIAVSRFVSANMLHFFLTGVTSLALTRFVREPRKWAMDSLQMLIFAIGLHGLYNALLSHPVPGLGDLSTFAWATLIGCAALFFRELEALAPPRESRGITRTALLCWGFCGLVCLELAWSSTQLSFNQALNQVGQAALAAALTCYIFIHYVQEPIR